MIRLILIVIYVLIWFVFHIPYVHRIKKEEDKEKLLNEKLQRLVRQILKLRGIRLQVEGKSNLPAEAVLLVANHESHLDPIILYACLDRIPYFVMKQEIEKIPVFRSWTQEIGHIALKRGDRRSSVEVVRRMKQYLQIGKDVLIFPEGTINYGEKELPFKPGSFRPAHETGASVVPVTIQGTARLLEKQQFMLKSGTVEIKIHPKIETKEGKWDSTRELSAYAEQIIKQELL
ncbi:lysophospholipid acyltransferase family protein [Bacillus sp. 165]|uniref:lysophospholipid acyltransferase family protein n=1 Tax=Bacillus sp. 165 TaxID=1529117 RepID=UPI001ADC1CA7|nr:lysophospholipid acyltransferase family protein [Bacillus sp. 165]MBO9128966.1 1-acyl-sn-glycerol-3-phosphate acyltransferase [Bacillus sp. 165]